MKTKVLLAAAVLVGMTASAFGAASPLIGSKHDLSITGGTNSVKSASQNQVCVFCHVPHNAVTNKLLWNRTNTVASFKIYTSYNTAAMRTAFIGTTALGADSTSLLCLSCHSLATALEVVQTYTGNNKGGGDSGNVGQWAQAGLGTSLTNDHPVGIDYGNAVISGANGFVPTVSGSGVVGAAGVRLFKSSASPAGDAMECASCHSVHNNANGKFLVMSNAASALCTQCHVK